MRQVLLAGVVLLVASPALAQQLPATTVQLPTVSQFTVRTTVSVPDGGMMPLGGVSSGFDRRVTRGLWPLGSRGVAGGRTAGGVSVSTRIIDHAELDRAVLAAAAAERETHGDASTAKARALSKVVAGSTPPPGSVAAIRQANALAAEREAAEVSDLFAKGQTAEAAGKTGVAKVYYQMVARRDQGQLKGQAEQRLAKLR